MHSSVQSAIECITMGCVTRDGSSKNNDSSDSGTSICGGNWLDLVSKGRNIIIFAKTGLISADISVENESGNEV